jgi:hypothetical protein
LKCAFAPYLASFMSLWPIKISFRPSPDKELIKEIKFDPNSPLIYLLFAACRIFDVDDCHNYEITY